MENNKILISISKEHANEEENVRKIFSKLDCDIKSDYERKSDGNLPMQIIIFIGESILSSAIWNTLCYSIKYYFKKFKNSKVLIEDNCGNIFPISNELKVNINKDFEIKKEIKKIKNIHSLGKYLIVESDASKEEYKRRFNFVFGAIVAALLGFVVNISSNIYYDVLMKGDYSVSKYDIPYFSFYIAILFLSIGFLRFFIYDYKNDFNFNLGFWDRFSFFLKDDFSLSRFARFLNKSLISLFLIFFIISVFNILYNIEKRITLIIIMTDIIFSFIILLIRDKAKKQE